VRAPADGYALLLVTTSSAINTTLFESKLNYNFLRDIVPIAGIFRAIYDRRGPESRTDRPRRV